jgi:hypothetical protein
MAILLFQRHDYFDTVALTLDLNLYWYGLTNPSGSKDVRFAASAYLVDSGQIITGITPPVFNGGMGAYYTSNITAQNQTRITGINDIPITKYGSGGTHSLLLVFFGRNGSSGQDTYGGDIEVINAMVEYELKTTTP